MNLWWISFQVDNPGSRIYTKGCVDAGEDWFNGNLVPVAAGLIVVAIIQVRRAASDLADVVEETEKY